MGIGKFELNDKQRRYIFATSIALVSLGFIPFAANFLMPVLNWKLGNMNITLGTILAVISLYGAWLLLPRVRTL